MRIVFPPSFKRPSQKPCPILCLNKAFVNFCCLLSIDHLSLTGSLTLHIRQPETEIPRAAFSAFMLSMSFSMFIAHRTASITKVTAAGTQPSSALIVAMVASGWAGSASLKPAMCRESVRSCVAPAWASFAASFGEEYADRVMAVMPMWSIILVVAGIFVFAILGGLLGKALLKKHFAKAGIA